MNAVMEERRTTCPHCEERLKKWLVPDGASWEAEYFLVCFNDRCSYYTDGWKWMREQYAQEASYRYAYNPSQDTSLMIPVWSAQATRGNIIEDDGEAT
jgi:hypothetical protein